MSKKKNIKRKQTRSTSKQDRSSFGLCVNDWDSIITDGYIPLSQNPEIISAVNKIANLVGTMTIYLMENRKNGDYRIKNALSKMVDVTPNPYMTRSTFIAGIVRCLLLEGDGNAVIFPSTKSGLLEGLYLLSPGNVSFVQDGFGYKMGFNGQYYTNDELIHVVMNPDPYFPWKGTGYRKSLKSVANTLNQASSTKKEFMESKWKPSIIVKVDSMTDEFSSKEGRSKLLEKYVLSNEAGEPWLIPADGFDVVQVKPLSLNDLAISSSVEMDKKTVASLLDVPPFVLGVGNFNRDEWNNFINTRINVICTAIQQAFTRSLLINPDWYFKFNRRSLMSYDLQTLSTVACDLMARGIISRNEARDSMDYSPKEGLDELVMLENYIPAGMIADQKKLNQGGENK